MIRATSPVLVGALTVAIIVGGLAGAGVTRLTVPAAAPVAAPAATSTPAAVATASPGASSATAQLRAC